MIDRASNSPLTRDRSRWSVRIRPTRLPGLSTDRERRRSGDVTTSSGLTFRQRDCIRREPVEPALRLNSEFNHDDQHGFREYHSSLTDRHRPTTTFTGGRLSTDKDALNGGHKWRTKRSESFKSETGIRQPCIRHPRRPQVVNDSIFTTRMHTCMQRAVLLSPFCLSTRPSNACTVTKRNNLLSIYRSTSCERGTFLAF